MEGYCLKCRKKRKMLKVHKVKKNKHVFAIGKCSVCGTKMSVVLK